ncbi:helix-turn-helix domain-containing protein [Streptomyces sp. Tu10]|nr:helix-turn-helix domain-containing protein [Streptomyces sp. Tu10]
MVPTPDRHNYLRSSRTITVLARSGVSLGDWIRTHRLAECKRELTGTEGRHRTIAATGRRWGFVDATHFSRVFKQAYGVSPRTWRDQNRAGVDLES